MNQNKIADFLFRLREDFRRLPDPRRGQGRRYQLDALLLLLVLGFLRNLTTIQEVLQRASYDRDLLEFLGWRRIPAQGTYTNLFQQMDLSPVNRLLWKVGVQLAGSDTQVAVDGKTIKGSQHREKRFHVVNVATPQGIPLSQVPSELAGGEIKSALRQLRRLDLQGKVVSGDALFAQKKLCETIEEKGGTGYSNGRIISTNRTPNFPRLWRYRGAKRPACETTTRISGRI